MGDVKNKRSQDKEKKDQNLHLRGTKSQMELLDIMSYEYDKTKTDMVWKALEFYRKLNKPPIE